MPATPTLIPATEDRVPRTPRGERTRERILDAAEALFSERGFAGTTLRDVAAAVGVRNPSLYNHFPNKESLYAAVLERGVQPVMQALADFMEAGDAAYQDSSPIVERMMEILAEHPDLPRLILHETLSGGERLTPMLSEWIAPIFARAQAIVQAGPAARRWEPDQIPLLVLALYHMVVGYFTIAPLYRELSGEDLLASGALERQTRILTQVANRLFPEED